MRIMAGKGDKPRSCFSKKFKDNYDDIDWGKGRSKKGGKRNPRRVLCDESRDRRQQGHCCGNNCKRSNLPKK